MRAIRITKLAAPRSFILYLLANVLLAACTATGATVPGASLEATRTSAAESASTNTCAVTEPVWAKPPDDSAVQGSPDYGYYFVNEDRSIWTSAWWTAQEENQLRVSETGFKFGWMRPAGVAMQITGQRIDASAPALEAEIPCCYPTRFQATGLYFPTEGCWEVTAKAADSELTFVIRVEP